MVYRLITAGTIEEKIYRKQVFKGSLVKSIVDKEERQHRYFTKQELCELFSLDDVANSECTTQKQLSELHSAQRVQDDKLTAHLEFLHSLGELHMPLTILTNQESVV